METWLQEFRIKPEEMGRNSKEISDEIKQILTSVYPECHLAHMHSGKILGAFFTNENGVNILIQGREDGIFTVDISNFNEESIAFDERAEKLGSSLKEMKYSVTPETPDFPNMPKIRRGEKFSRNDHASGYLVERDFDRVVFDEVTPFQHIRILHSPQYGNCMYVDNDLNIAESDYEEYTYFMSGFGMADYTGKTVLVLGGGDGGVLRYLKGKNPAMITVVDIDQRCIDASKLHMKRICGDALDSMEGENYKIVVDDALNYLPKCIQNGLSYDYVINEITAIPVLGTPWGSDWDFLCRLLELGLKVVKPDGMYFCHGASKKFPQSLERFERKLSELEWPLEFTKKVSNLPSYLETWLVYAIWKKEVVCSEVTTPS